MNNKASKLLHISSDQEEQPNQNIEKNDNNTKKYGLKFGNFKGDSYQMQRNILDSQEKDQIFFDENQQKISNIKIIGEQYFNIQNHTINNKTSRSQYSNQTLLNQLNITKNTQKYNKNQDQNPQLNELKKQAARNKKNLLQTNFDNSQDQKQNNSIQHQNQTINQNYNSFNAQQKIRKISQDEQEGEGQMVIENQQQKSQKNSQKIDDSIKQFEWDIQQHKSILINHRMKQNQRIKIIIQRQQSGMNYFLPQFDMIYDNDTRHILSCKKQLGTKFQYNISLDNLNFSQKSNSFVGKIIGNFTNSVFQTIDILKKAIICTTKFKQDIPNPINAPMIYQAFLLNQNSSYSELVGAHQNYQKGLDQLYLIPVNRKHITYFRNKKPEYCQKLKAYMLNFNGRINKGSIKNFIIEDTKSGREVLMFGKGHSQKFNLYFSAPLNPFIAFGIVIPHFASKVLTK